MNAGITYAQQHKLRPGIALTAAQMATLTLNARAASVQAGGNLTATAGNNIAITAGQQSSSDLLANSTTSKGYSPKYFPCATAECVKTGGNLDMSDAGTQAYVRALDKKVMDDINTAATVGTIVAPVGVVGTIAGYVGPTTSLISGLISDQGLAAAFKEGLQLGAAKYLSNVYKFSEALSNRLVAAVDLAGGWQAFVDRTMSELKNEK
ncbi:hypothetical protein [Curvibacter delicatus]|jgi:hypothetical protein|uniref:hypothetical protein n=1 Tax=Curvibacter delicatus TaxID=80879 RepID=UPI000A7894DA|nr:hypothetical protein [Curvibacter delicatus]